jgi:prepilin-type N-terminal cleavage/methylation domain-containing protein
MKWLLSTVIGHRGEGGGCGRRAESDRGFTLIEVIAVLIMVGILTAVVISRLTGTATYSAPSAAEELKTHLRYAQTRAMSSSSVWGVFFTDGGHYTIFYGGNTGNTTTPPGSDGATVDLSSRGLSVSENGGVPGVIAFDSWGKPYTDATGSTAQSTTRTLSVTGGSAIAPIQITKGTGYIP